MLVAPREGRVSRNPHFSVEWYAKAVAPREGRVSRNRLDAVLKILYLRRAPRGACE